MDVAELHRRTVETWTARVRGVAADQWDRPTPCTDWNVRALVNHVVGEDAWTMPLMRGATIAEIGDSLDGDLLGQDPLATGETLADEAVAVVAERLPAGEKVHLSYGDEDPAEYVRQLSADHLIHAWDLAAATGQDRTLDADLVDEVATWFVDREEIYRGAGFVGARVDGAADDPQARLLAAGGRDAAWTPPQP
ncbi:TIGR03086 family protein [Nocardioides panacis]|uniref:TIGR03086 family protein n=1 Tax=Nocardioides panacis TaxID=2849501 RepID=A0A975SWH2_9ACTN|nr:TIGR03086 family metal-binding protein [Nocardioides panacis]QWZ06579.1 TIGR03086 family protein [Nocardioides panacis]